MRIDYFIFFFCQEMEVEGGGGEEADWTRLDKSYRECQDTLRAQQLALEILANLCTLGNEEEEDESNWQDNPSDNEEEEIEEEEEQQQLEGEESVNQSVKLVFWFCFTKPH
jgi:hypothetical protein